MNPIVMTRYGAIEGLPLEDGHISFRGVPYAAPPVDELRWRAPVDPEKWEGVRPAKEYSRAAWSLGCDMEPFVTDFYYMGYPEMSEDCLYLNVDTAFGPGEKRPVYVWFHGGGLSSGYSFEIEFDPSELVKRGVVVVTVGQRLGLFGYLALPQLYDEAGRAGNYGFLDQIKAMEWVRDNIAAFGGDPDNVTIGGQSGGSQKCCLLAASDRSRRLFKRIILHSGLKYRQEIPSPEAACAAGKAFLAAMGLPEDASMDDLRKIPAEKFLENRELYGKFAPGKMTQEPGLMPWADLRDAVLAGQMDGYDVMVGTTLGEATKKDFYNKADALAEFRATLGEDYAEFEQLQDITDENAFLRYRELTSLGLLPCGGTAFSRNLSLNRLFAAYMKRRDPEHKRYNFYFTHLLPNRECEIGGERDSSKLLAWHTSDLWFAFNSLRDGRSPSRPWRECDFALGGRMCDFIANFITAGDPNGENLPRWPEGAEDYGYMVLAEDCRAVTGLDAMDRVAFRYVSREYGIEVVEC